MSASTELNRYEQAINQLEHLRERRFRLVRRLRELEAAMDAAEAELVACELKPGIPLPEYREVQVTAQ